MEKWFDTGQRVGSSIASPAHLERTLAALGGEALLKRRYPQLYQAVLNTRRSGAMCMSSLRGDAEYLFGAADSCKIRTLNYSPNTTLETSSSIATDKSKVSLAIIGELKDTDTGKVIDGFAVYDNNSDQLSAQSVTKASELGNGDNRNFTANSSFVIVENDASGKPVVKTLESTMEAPKTRNAGYIVKSMTVNAPMPVLHPGAKKTTVYYNRKGSGADYMFSDVKFSTTDIDVYMPFSGSVELNGIYQPDPADPIVKDGDKGIVLQMENVKNGSVNFDLKYWSKIKWTVSGSVLSWEFPNDWHDVISKKRLSCANDLNFYCRMYINTTIGLAVPITIQSSGPEHEDPSYQKIPYIDILWGCFAKDVRITMADGSVKTAEQIRAGDMVSTKENGAQRVTEVVTGQEERLVYIETSRGDRIRVSGEHPVLSDTGLVRADELTAGTILVTESGLASIESLYYVEYGDRVYNFSLEKESTLLANGFYAGDFAAQNRRSRPTEKEPEKLTEIQEELSELIGSLAKKKKENL